MPSPLSSRYHKLQNRNNPADWYEMRFLEMDEKRIVICTFPEDEESFVLGENGDYYSTEDTPIEIFNRWTLELERVCQVGQVE